MSTKMKYILVISTVLLGIWIVYPIFTASVGVIDEKIVSLYLGNNDNLVAKSRIAKIILKDTDKEKLYKKSNLLSLDFGYIKNESGDDMVAAININGEKTVIALYEKIDAEYSFVCELGTFFDVNKLGVYEINKDKQQFVFLREKIDQTKATNEVSTYLRGYIYNGESFDMILSICGAYRGFSDISEKNSDKTYMLMYDMDSVYNIDLASKRINVNTIQYLKNYAGKSLANSSVPDVEYFKDLMSKNISLEYKWSDKYNSFIICEAVHKKTGLVYAIIEDLSNQPQELYAEIIYVGKYRLKDEAGNVFIDDESKYNMKK